MLAPETSSRSLAAEDTAHINQFATVKLCCEAFSLPVHMPDLNAYCICCRLSKLCFATGWSATLPCWSPQTRKLPCGMKLTWS